MRLRSSIGRLVTSGALALGTFVPGPAPAPTDTPAFDEVVDGDFLQATTPSAGSGATITIPAGTDVTYAQLTWDGNCDADDQTLTFTAPTATTAVHVDAADGGHFGTFATDLRLIDELPRAVPLTVTGNDCAGAWSLILVHERSDPAPARVAFKHVLVYKGHQNAAVSFPVPHLTIAARAPAQPVSAGATATFTATVANPSDTEAADVLVSWETGCPPQPLAPLAPGATYDVTCATTIPADTGPSFDNRVTMTWGMPGGTTATAGSPATAAVVHPAIDVAIAAGGRPVRAGDEVTLTMDVTNTGADADLHDVAVGELGGGACAPWPVGGLARGEHVRKQCTVRAGDGDLGVTVAATGTAVDGTKADDHAKAAVQVIHPNLTVSQRPSATAIRAGDTLTYTTTVENTGDSALIGVNATTTLAGLSCTPLVIGVLMAGAKHTVTCTIATDQSTKSLANTFTATGTALDGSPVTAQDGPGTVTVIHPAVSVTIKPPQGPVVAAEPATFTVTVTNDSPDTALTGVAVTQTSAGQNGEAAPDTACAYPTDPQAPPKTLALRGQPGAALTYDCAVTVAAGTTTYTTSVTATGTAADQGTVTHQATSTVPVQAPNPALRLTKTADTQQTTVGSPVTFTVTIENTGNVPLAVEVTDQSAPDCGMTVSALPVGGRQQQSCGVTATVLGTLSNVATFTARPAGVPSGTPLTGTSQTVQVRVDPAPAAPPSTPPPPTGPTGQSGQSGQSPAPAAGGLASTGVSLAWPATAAFGLLLGGSLLRIVGRRPHRRTRRPSGRADARPSAR